VLPVGKSAHRGEAGEKPSHGHETGRKVNPPAIFLSPAHLRFGIQRFHLRAPRLWSFLAGLTFMWKKVNNSPVSTWHQDLRKKSKYVLRTGAHNGFGRCIAGH
jgi:hypothetical protein